MKIARMLNLACFVFIQLIGTQTVWKQVDTIPLTVKSTEKNITRSVSYHPLPLEVSYLAVANANIIPGNDIVIYNVNQTTGGISNPKGFSLRDGQDINPQWIDFSPNGNFISVAVMDGIEVRKFTTTGLNAPTIQILDHPTSFFPISESKSEAAAVSSLVYSSDGKWLAAVQEDLTISVFAVNTATGVLFNRQVLLVESTRERFKKEDYEFTVTFSLDSRFLAVHGKDSIEVFANPGIICPTCQTLFNLSNNSHATCTRNVN